MRTGSKHAASRASASGLRRAGSSEAASRAAGVARSTARTGRRLIRAAACAVSRSGCHSTAARAPAGSSAAATRVAAWRRDERTQGRPVWRWDIGTPRKRRNRIRPTPVGAKSPVLYRSERKQESRRKHRSSREAGPQIRPRFALFPGRCRVAGRPGPPGLTGDSRPPILPQSFPRRIRAALVPRMASSQVRVSVHFEAVRGWKKPEWWDGGRRHRGIGPGAVSPRFRRRSGPADPSVEVVGSRLARRPMAQGSCPPSMGENVRSTPAAGG